MVLFVFLRAVYIRKYYKFKNSEAAKKFIELQEKFCKAEQNCVGATGTGCAFSREKRQVTPEWQSIFLPWCFFRKFLNLLFMFVDRFVIEWILLYS
jgi:hypothetical protein